MKIEIAALAAPAKFGGISPVALLEKARANAMGIPAADFDAIRQADEGSPKSSGLAHTRECYRSLPPWPRLVSRDSGSRVGSSPNSPGNSDALSLTLNATRTGPFGDADFR